MIRDRRGNMPFAVIAVTLLLMASVAGAVTASYSGNRDSLEELTDGTDALSESADKIGSYIDQELGIIILEISRDSTLGTLDERASVFLERAYEWIDKRFPMNSNGLTAKLCSRELSLKSESLEIMDGDSPIGGYTPSYLRGTGTVSVSISSQFGYVSRDIEISTDGSYGLPLACERGSVFENMTSEGGISVSQIMTYELTSLAQLRVLNGYGARSEYGSRGTDAIITREDVRKAYDNALSVIGLLSFRDADGEEIPDGVDPADLLAGDCITIDAASFCGQVLASVIDDIVLKWFDYFCGNYIVSGIDRLIGRYVSAIHSILAYINGTDPFSAWEYIVSVMEDSGISETVYRYPGTGTTSLTIGGHSITVENPVKDLGEQDWVTEFRKHYDCDGNYIEDLIRSIINTAAAEVYASDIQPVILRTDPYDETRFIDAVADCFRSLAEECTELADSAIADIMKNETFSDPFYSAIAETVLSHASDMADTEGFLSAVRSALESAASDDEDIDAMMSSSAVERAVLDYRRAVTGDLEIFGLLKNVEGGQPGIVISVLSSAVSLGLRACGITSLIGEKAETVLNEITATLDTDPYSGIIDLPDSGYFILQDSEGNCTKETLALSYSSDPVISEPVLKSDGCIHVTGFREDLSAAYSTSFTVSVSDSITYVVSGSSGLSRALDAAPTSQMTGSFLIDLELEIAVASAWALKGAEYTPSCTIVSDAWEALLKILEPIMEPLRCIMEAVRNVIDSICCTLGDAVRYVASAAERIYNAVIEPLTEICQWAEETFIEIISQGTLDLFCSLDLSDQKFGFEYLGYTFTLSFDLATATSSTKTLFTASLSGPIAGLLIDTSITVKVKGDMKAENVFITGKAKVTGDDWKISMNCDPLMKGSSHILSLSASIGDTDISVILPDLEDYHELGFSLSDIPGLGDLIDSIPIPGLGVNIGLNAGVSLKYSAPVVSGLIVNEYETNPEGDDKGKEWVELLNNSDKTIELDGYTLSASSNYKTKKMVLSGSIAPGEFLVIEPTFTLVNSSGKLTKNGEGLILKDAEGVVIDKTGTHKDGDDDSKTWQRSYDGSSKWVLAEQTMGRSNGSYVMTNLITVSDAKDIVADSLEQAFSEAGSITDISSLQEIIQLTVRYSLDGIIEKVSGCLVEASVYAEANISDATSSASAGIRIALRTDSELAEDVLKYIAGKIESVILSMKNPYCIDGISMFTDNIDLEVTFDAEIGFPKILNKDADLPKIDLGITFRTNMSAISSILGADTGRPGVEFGIRILDCPAAVIPSKMSPKKGMEHDLWLIRVNVEWDA